MYQRFMKKSLQMSTVLLFVLGLTASVFTSCHKENPIIPNEPDEPGTIAVTSISLNETSITLAKGETYILEAIVEPDNATDKDVIWSTSDDSKVSVSADGRVTAVAAGEAFITAAAGGKNTTCRVIVSESEIAVTSITLDKTSLDLFSGDVSRRDTNFGYLGFTDEFLLTTVKPDNATNKTVTWTSSNTSIVEVLELPIIRIPFVFVRGKGNAVITAKAGDKTATCTVTVLEIKLDKREIELVVGEEYTLYATTDPSGQPVTWTSSNTSIATVAGDYGGGKGVAKAPGTATINATYKGQTVSCNITVYDVPLSGVTIEGVTWAARNVNAPGTFAKKVSDSGMFYQWNSKIGYSEHEWMYSYQTGTTWSSENDPCPTGWRLPTLSEAQTLQSKVINPEPYTGFKGRSTIIDGQECLVRKFENNQHLVFRSDYPSAFHFQTSYWTNTPNGSEYAYAFKQKETYSVKRDQLLRLRCVKK